MRSCSVTHRIYRPDQKHLVRQANCIDQRRAEGNLYHDLNLVLELMTKLDYGNEEDAKNNYQ